MGVTNKGQTVLIGAIDVESGSMVLADDVGNPAYEGAGTKLTDMFTPSKEAENGYLSLPGGGLLIATHGDGSFPVYASFDSDGLLEKLVIWVNASPKHGRES